MIAADRAATYRAIVVNTQDPEGRNRCQLQIPQLMGGARSGWAMPIPAVGAEVPAVGDQVMVTFEGADLTRPAYFAPTASKVAQEALLQAQQAQTTAQTGVSNAQAAQVASATAQARADLAVTNAKAADDKAVAAQVSATTGTITLDRLRQSTNARDTAMLTQLGGDLPDYLPPDQIRSVDGGNLFPDPDMVYRSTWGPYNGVAETTSWRAGQGRRAGTGALVTSDWPGMTSGQSGQYVMDSRKSAIPVVPGTTYLLSGWVKASATAPANSASLYAKAWDSMTSGRSSVFCSPGPVRNANALAANTWTKVSGKITVPDGYYWLTPGCYREAAAVGIDLIWCDLSVQQVTSAALLSGGVGSGVDADKLDGQDATAFMLKSGYGTVPFTMAAGTYVVPATTPAGYYSAGTFTFPAGRFTQPPIVTVTVNGAPGGSAKAVPRVSGVSTSGCAVYIYNGDGTQGTLPAISVHWTAVQMTSASAAG